MEKEKLISVIIPIYNANVYLSACIQSILDQTYTDLELLLIDDGSTDASGKICDQYAQKDSRVKVVHNTNHGVSYSRNMGLALAKGEYITFCDADDLYKQNYIMKMRNAAQSQDADIVICNYSYLHKPQNKICERASGSIEKEEIYRRMFINNTIGGFVWNKFFRKDTIGEIHFDENMQICEDTYFVCRALKNAKKVYYVGESLYLYRVHQNSTMSNVQNMFDENGRLKYAVVFEKILQEGTVEKQYAQYVQADECVLAISVKCDYLNSGALVDKKIIKRLNRNILHNFFAMITCKYYSAEKKLTYIGNACFNLRKFKCIFSFKN